MESKSKRLVKLNKKKSNRPSHRMSVSFKTNLYDELLQIKNDTHTKSFSRVVNILLNDEVNNENRFDISTQQKLTKELAQFSNKIGTLNLLISGACNNLNQIAYDLNMKKKSGQKITKNDFTEQYELEIYNDKLLMDKYKNNLKNVRKDVNKIWQLLM